MTSEEIDKLTIAEVRAIADRAHEALSHLREVQGLLVGAVAARPVAESAAPARPMFDPQHQALKEALLAQNKARFEGLPDEIQSMERT